VLEDRLSAHVAEEGLYSVSCIWLLTAAATRATHTLLQQQASQLALPRLFCRWLAPPSTPS